MEDWGWFRRTGYGALQAVGLGFLAGAMETIALAASLKLPLSTLDFLAMGAVDILLMGALGAVAGFAGGVLGVGDARDDVLPSRLVAAQLGVAALLLSGYYLWQGAFAVWDRDQPAGAVAMAVMPVGFAGVVYTNALYWLRRVELGKAPRVGWLPLSGSAALLIALVAAVAYPLRNTGGTYALEGDPNAILVTVDGLRRSDLADGGMSSFHRLVAGGVGFDDAVTPATETTPAAASVLTGLHPLRNQVLYDGDRLAAGFRTLAEALEMEGYATGGFVSDARAGGEAGLDQGFRIFDDDFAPFLPAVARINLVRRVGWLVRRVRGAPPGRRGPGETVARFETWYAQHRDVPHFAWIHLAVAGDDVAAVDGALNRIVDLVEEGGRAEDTLLILAGAYGRPAGRRFLTEAEVRVPLAMRAPGRPVEVQVVPSQVRLMDIGQTVMAWTRLDTLGETEGVSLLDYAAGERSAPMSCALVGRDDLGRPILGLRTAGVKWVRDAEDGDHLFDLARDPEERVDLAGEQERAVRQARTSMASDIVAFRTLLELRGEGRR